MQYKRSKIKSIQASGTWETRDGKTMYQSEVELEDGTTGEVNATTPDRWNVGDEVDYEVKDGKYGNKLKLSKARDGFSWANNSESTSNSVTRFENRDERRQHLIMNQWAIKTAIETEMNLSPPDKFELRNAIAVAKLLKQYALDLENVDCSLQAEQPVEMPF
tara:strand:+ start:920 stop:1405 length:486 start_codon:yes stop_codon:yes gene_type:complete